MSESEIAITYQTLFELFRRECNREELQPLEPDFFRNVVSYIKEKKESIIQQRQKEDLFAEEEGKKAEVEFESIRKVIRRLYEKRESKIITMALDSSRTDSSIVDTSAMLPEERELYKSLQEGLDKFRTGILITVLEGKSSTIQVERDPEEMQEAPDAPFEEPEEKPKEESKEENIKVKFTESMPSFVGEDFNEYGPYEPGQEAALPPQITTILLEKGVIQKV